MVGRLPLRAPKKPPPEVALSSLSGSLRTRRDDSVADLPLRRPAPILPAIVLEAALARAHAEQAQAEPLRRVPKSTVTDADPPRLRRRRGLVALIAVALLSSAATLWLTSCATSDSTILPSSRPQNLGDANGRGLGFSLPEAEEVAAR